MVNLLITGSEGFIGSAVVKHFLNKGFNIIAITRNKNLFISPNLRYVAYDKSFKNLQKVFSDFDINCVFHLASNQKLDITDEHVNDLIDSNILFGIHLLQAMLNTKCRNFINIGSFWQNNQDGIYRPMNLYAASKQAFSDLLKWYCLDMDISAISLILFDTYGPNDKRKKIFSMLRECRDKNFDIDMTKGEQILYPVHIKDILNGFEVTYKLLNSKKRYQNPNFSLYSNPISLYKLVSKWNQISPRKVKVNWGVLPYRKSQIMKPFLGERLPGWKSSISISNGLHDTI